MPRAASFRRDLLRWYSRSKRDLPWRQNRNPYSVWISEIMLQQTRVQAVIPYYKRFLERFPDIASLASAGEQQLLAAWAGLGYYSRARNLQAAAKLIARTGEFPTTHDGILQLPGIGPYTAAAIASIAFELPHAALDGNITRVLSRLLAEPGDIGSEPTRVKLQNEANRLLDPKRPGDHNQAMMELGATICLPAQPRCLLCPVAACCEARRTGRQAEFPIKRKRAPANVVKKQLLIVSRNDEILFRQVPADSRRLPGFWELPEPGQLSAASIGRKVGDFRHSIVTTNYHFEVLEGSIAGVPVGFMFLDCKLSHEVPLSTTANKALACLKKQN